MVNNRKCVVFLLPILEVLIVFGIIFNFVVCPALAQEHQNTLKTYFVHVNKPRNRVNLQSEDLYSWYESFWPLTTASFKHQPLLVYSYQNMGTSFAARLTPEEAETMEKKDDLLLVRQERMFSLHTTHSPTFLGLHQEAGFWKKSNFGKGVTVRVIDTGIRPFHPSFRDEGMPPPPAKWKGKCEFKQNVCNNKIIGARNLLASTQIVTTEEPIDEIGHGTHTASTIAGSLVRNGNVFGNANGTAVGIAPYAHLAIYKVCTERGCAQSAILAAFDSLIEDGVDVISVSLGGGTTSLFMDGIAVGAFAATKNGIFASSSAGNGGPTYGSLTNEAPRVLSVGASTIDRRIVATAKLGNGQEFDVQSLFQPKNFSSSLLLPLVHLGGNPCTPETLKYVNVTKKIVSCVAATGVSRVLQGEAVKNASGAAMIFTNGVNTGYTTLADIFPLLPTTHVSYAAGLKIQAYIDSTRKPMASILFKGTVIGDSSAPMVAAFSSRGPNVASPGILKPDIIGPGVGILAAWPFPLDDKTPSKINFKLMSGASMSCPHLSAIAALLKSSHPDWSPAAIKSAILTTANTINLKGKPILDELLLPANMFAIGAGHVNPSKANDPGLIYDIKPNDYIPYPCGLNYTDRQIGILFQSKVKCIKGRSIREANLNYPSFSVLLGSSPQTYMRTVTNVGQANSSYTVEVVPPNGIDVSVKPKKITFASVQQMANYWVTFTANNGGMISNITSFPSQGYLNWVSYKHAVRTPISVTLI